MTQLSLDDRRPNVANISPCGVYRYTLTREFGGDRTAVFCGLNPSTADADKDDNTIRKDIGFTRLWQCGRLLKVNGEAYRATDPNDLKRARKAGIDTNGPENDDAIRQALGFVLLTSGIFVAAWGNHVTPQRQAEIARLIRFSGVTPMCLGTNQNGTPKHELYIPYETELRPWSSP